MKETITKFTPIEYPKVDFDPSKYTLEELDAIEHKILKEQTDRRKLQEDIDLIELKIKYEHKWIKFGNDTKTILYVKNIETTYCSEVVKFSIDKYYYDEHYNYYVETTHLGGNNQLDGATVLDRSEAFRWLYNFEFGFRVFIDNLEGD